VERRQQALVESPGVPLVRRLSRGVLRGRRALRLAPALLLSAFP